MPINPDFRDLFFEFNARDVRYLLVGGYAFSFHARPRNTTAIDVWIDATAGNAQTVTFDEAWAARVAGKYGDQGVWFLSRELLIRNKRALGRKQDLADVEALEDSAS